MRLFFCVSRLLHARQQCGLILALAKGLLAGTMGVVFSMFWGILTLLWGACGFVIHYSDLLFGLHLARGQT